MVKFKFCNWNNLSQNYQEWLIHVGLDKLKDSVTFSTPFGFGYEPEAFMVLKRRGGITSEFFPIFSEIIKMPYRIAIFSRGINCQHIVIYVK